MKIVTDTNILISASFWKGNPHKVIKLVENPKIEIFISKEILQEYKTVLTRDFKTSEEEASERTLIFATLLKIVVPKEKIPKITEDPDDNKILEAAVEANADYIVSGDRHLLKLGKFRGIQILKAKNILEIAQRTYQ